MDTTEKLEKFNGSTQTKSTVESFFNDICLDVKLYTKKRPSRKCAKRMRKRILPVKLFRKCAKPKRKRILPVKPLPNIKDEDRQTTDDLWTTFFIVIVICCLITVLHASIDMDYGFKSLASNTDTSNKSTLAPDVTNVRIIPIYNTIAKNISELSHHQKDLPTDFYLMACNLSQLTSQKHFGALAHIFISVILLMVGLLGVTADDNVLSKQPTVFATIFLFVTIIVHSLIVPVNEILSSSSFPHYQLSYWLIPDVLVLIILLWKLISAVRYQNSENLISMVENVDNDRSIDWTFDNDVSTKFFVKLTDRNGSATEVKKCFGMKNHVYRKIPFHYYIPAIMFGFPFVIILAISTITATNLMYKVDWNTYTYIIAGCSFYIIHTIFYYGLMLTACTTKIFIDNEDFNLKSLTRAVVMITRRHFGTACFHGMPIFAYLREYYITYKCRTASHGIKRCLLERFKYDEFKRLLPTITATRGCDYSDSVRELYRIVTTTTRMHKYFSDFGGYSIFLMYVLLLPTNNLINIFKWYSGTYDSDLAKQSWMMYVTILFILYITMKFFRTVTDTIELRLYHTRFEMKSSFFIAPRPKKVEYYV